MIEHYDVALFNRAPNVGDVNPPGEVPGTLRAPAVFVDGVLADSALIGCNVDAWASHIVVLDGAGRVVHVAKLRQEWIA